MRDWGSDQVPEMGLDNMDNNLSISALLCFDDEAHCHLRQYPFCGKEMF